MYLCTLSHLDLVLAMFGRCFGLVQPLERAVHALVETPVSFDGDPVQVHLILDEVECLDGPLENAGEGHIEGEVLLLQQLSEG